VISTNVRKRGTDESDMNDSVKNQRMGAPRQCCTYLLTNTSSLFLYLLRCN